MNLNNTDKVNALISLANRAHAETLRYRDHVWKIVAWTVALLVAILAAARTSQELWVISSVKIIFCFVSAYVAISGIRDVTFDYLQFVRNRNWQRKCERLLKFFEENEFIANESLLPKSWKNADYRFKHCLGHYIQWVIIILLVSAYAIASIALMQPPAGT